MGMGNRGGSPCFHDFLPLSSPISLIPQNFCNCPRNQRFRQISRFDVICDTFVSVVGRIAIAEGKDEFEKRDWMCNDFNPCFSSTESSRQAERWHHRRQEGLASHSGMRGLGKSGAKCRLVKRGMSYFSFPLQINFELILCLLSWSSLSQHIFQYISHVDMSARGRQSVGMMKSA